MMKLESSSNVRIKAALELDRIEFVTLRMIALFSLKV